MRVKCPPTIVSDQNPLVVLVREQEHLLIWRRFVCRCPLHRIQEVLVAAVVGRVRRVVIVLVRRLVAVLCLLRLAGIGEGNALRRCSAVDLSVVLLLVAVEKAHLPPLTAGEKVGLLWGGHRLCWRGRLHGCAIGHGGIFYSILSEMCELNPFHNFRHLLLLSTLESVVYDNCNQMQMNTYSESTYKCTHNLQRGERFNNGSTELEEWQCNKLTVATCKSLILALLLHLHKPRS